MNVFSHLNNMKLVTLKGGVVNFFYSQGTVSVGKSIDEGREGDENIKKES